MKLLKPEWVQHKGKPIFSLNVHPDGSRLATGGQGEDAGGLIMIWNMAPLINENSEMDESVPKILSQMDDHASCVNCVRWSHNGIFLASGGDDKVVLIWQMTRNAASTVFGTGGAVVNFENWKNRHVLRGHTGDILDIAWSPDDSYIASASIDNTIIIWNAKKFPAIEHTIKQHESLVKGVTFDPVGKYLASQSDDKSLCIWNTSDWSLEKKITEPFKESSGTTHALRLDWSPDGHCIATAHAMNNGGTVSKIVERNGWKAKMDFVGHRKAVTVIRFNQRLLSPIDATNKMQYVCCAIGSRDRSISVWLTSLKRPLVVINNLFENTVMDISWSKCGYYMVACSLDGSVAMFEFDEGELGKVLSEEEKYILHKKTYGTSIKASKSLILSTVVENPDFLKPTKEKSVARKQQSTSAVKLMQALTTPTHLKATSPVNKTPDSKFHGTFSSSSSAEKLNSNDILKKQKESKTKDGKRRIVPMLLEPPPNFENDFVSEPLSSSKQNQSLTTPIDENRSMIQNTSPLQALTANIPIISQKAANTTTTTTSIMVKRKADVLETTPKKTKKKKKERNKNNEELPTPTSNQEETHVVKTIIKGSLEIPHPEPVSRLSVQVNTSSFSGEEKKSSIEVENNLSNKDALSYVKCVANDVISWEACLSSVVTVLAANKFMVCVATEDCSIHVFSTRGSRLLPTLVLDSRVSHLKCCLHYLMVITTAGFFSVWNVKAKKIHIHNESLSPILKGADTSITNTFVNKKGQPVVSLADQSSYIYDHLLSAWVLVSDGTEKLRTCADLGSCVKGQNPKGPLHSMQTPLNRLSASISRQLQNNVTKQQSCTISYLESQIQAAISIGSAEEYQFWLMTYTRYIVQNGEESRLRDLCEDLVGPVHSTNKGDWKSKILTHEKRDLLKDILPVIASNLQFQRFYSEIQQLLDEATKR